MEPHERLVARWLTEEWDGEDQELPKWLKKHVWLNFTMRDFGKPHSMARAICLKLLENHKNEISMQSTKI